MTTHIRNEWQQFVEWDYKKVSTICGSKVIAKNAVIPGVSPRPEKGYCIRCARSVSATVESINENLPMAVGVRQAYSDAWFAVQPEVEAHKASERERRARQNAARIAEGKPPLEGF